MPIYEFQCAKGHVTEKLMRANDIDRIKSVSCDECAEAGKPSVAKRILSPTPTTFKFAGGRKP